MPQPTKGARLGGSPAHQRLILANLATSLFQHGKIKTTEAKARRLRPYAERLITKAKRGDLHNRREIQKVIRDRETVHRLMHEIGPFFADRNGGYTRITKTIPRQGDNAPMAVIELVSQKTVTDEADRARRVAGSQRRDRRGAAPATEEVGPTAGQNAVDEAEGSTATSPEATGSAETVDVAEKAEEASEAALEAAAAAPEGSTAQEKAFDAADSAEQAAEAAEENSSATDDAPAGEHTPGSAAARTADEEGSTGPVGPGRES